MWPRGQVLNSRIRETNLLLITIFVSSRKWFLFFEAKNRGLNRLPLKSDINSDIIFRMDRISEILSKARQNPTSISFDDLDRLCRAFFGNPRQEGTSHRIFKTPWPGDPRVNIQRGNNGMAKPYQVRQVLKAIGRLAKVKESDENG